MTIIAGPLPTPTVGDQKLTPAVDRRARYSHLSPGLLASTDGVVTQNGTPDMRVLVAAISGAIVDDGLAFGQGKYWFESDAQVIVGPLNAADPGLGRVDLIVAKVNDTEAGDGSLTPQITFVTGSPNASPTAPSVPARCEALAEISVPAGDTTITNGQITDRRRYSAANPRVGCQLHKTASSVATGTTTAITWGDEDQDTDGFIAVPGTTVTIPAGLGGLYAITFVTEGAFGTGRAFVSLNVVSSIAHLPDHLRKPMEPAEDRGLVSVTVPLAAGDTFTCEVFHSTGSSVTFESYLACYRVGI